MQPPSGLGSRGRLLPKVRPLRSGSTLGLNNAIPLGLENGWPPLPGSEFVNDVRDELVVIAAGTAENLVRPGGAVRLARAVGLVVPAGFQTAEDVLPQIVLGRERAFEHPGRQSGHRIVLRLG